MGPLKAIGTALHTVGTVVSAVDNVIVRTDGLLNKGFDAIDIAVDGGLTDLEADHIINDAHRKVRIAKARTEADRIIAQLDPVASTEPAVEDK